MSDADASLYRALKTLVSPIDVKITVRKDPTWPYVGLENIPSRGARLVGRAFASSSISTNSIFQAGDILFGKLRPNLRKCVVAPFDGYCSTDILVLRPNIGVDPGFAGKVLRTERVGAAAERTSVGTKMPRTSWGHLRELEIFCPNLAEQSKIAQVLDTLDAAIHETEAIIAKLKAVKQGLLHDLLTRGMNANGELRPPQAEAPHLYRESPLGWIPKEWRTSTFAELQSQPVLGVSNRGASLDAPNIGLLKMGNLGANNELNLTSVEQLAVSRVADMSELLLQDGDLLFNTRNTPELVGKTCSWRGMGVPHVFDNNILRARLPEHIGTGHYFADYLGSEIGRRQLLRLATGTTSVAAIYWKDLRYLRMPVPPLPEQKAIHERIDTVDVERAFAEQSAQVLRQMKAGLMEDLLTGRVRVTPLMDSALP